MASAVIFFGLVSCPVTNSLIQLCLMVPVSVMALCFDNYLPYLSEMVLSVFELFAY